jgi:O-methyltransferase involved in polyketide biosynthesis
VGADLTDPNWPDAIPTDRPGVIVADGLMAFLTPDEWVSLFARATSPTAAPSRWSVQPSACSSSDNLSPA